MSLEITLGPVLFNWPVDEWQDFYFQIADEADIERVYLGEVVCSKRVPLFDKHIDRVIQRLKNAGKRPIYSTMAEVSNGLDRHVVKNGVAKYQTDVEVNDVSALWHLSDTAHAIGPYMNVYNEESLRHFVSKGATNICLPPELPAIGIAELARVAKETDTKLEVQVYGRLPLALSARCYHARAHGLQKDTCAFVCDQDPDGMVLETLDDKPFLVINGIQTMSYRCLNLVHEIKQLAELGVSCFRISPHSKGTLEIISIFNDVVADKLEPAEADARLKKCGLDAPFSNGFYHQQAGVEWHIGGS